jgi:hypothetical protein
MNSKEIFSVALSIESPWEVKEVKFSTLSSSSECELHIYLDFERGYKFTTRTGELSVAYDTEEKQWQHLNFFQHRCYLHARVPRVKDAEGGTYSTGSLGTFREWFHIVI